MINKFLYKSYCFFYSSTEWRRRHFTTPGLLVLALLLISAGLGLDTYTNTIYQVFTFLLPVLGISVFWSLFFFAEFDCKRKLPKFATVGEKIVYTIEIENRTKKKQKGLLFYENTEDPRPSYDELLRCREPEEERRNLWDRKTLYYRWLWLIDMNKNVLAEEYPLPEIVPGGIAKISSEMVPLGRGYVRLAGITITRPDPFGLFKAFVKLHKQQSLLVLPKRYDLPPINLPGTRKHHSGGVALASSVGNSEEFVSLRSYRPGDPMQRIHWKSWAKTGELIIKEFQDEFFVRHALILDTFHDAENCNAFEEAVSIAASFVCSANILESMMDLMFVGNQAYCFSTGRNTADSDKIMEILACVKSCHNKSFSSLLPIVMEHAYLLSGCICILIAWDKERQKLIEELQSLGIPVMVIVISDDASTDLSDTLELMKNIPEAFHVLRPGKIQGALFNRCPRTPVK